MALITQKVGDMAVIDRVTPVPLTWSTALRALLTAIAAVLFGVGWLLSKLVRGIKLGLIGVGFAVGWSIAAMKVGYEAGRGSA